MSILLQFSYPQLSIINILLLSDQLFQGSVAPHLDVLSMIYVPNCPVIFQHSKLTSMGPTCTMFPTQSKLRTHKPPPPSANSKLFKDLIPSTKLNLVSHSIKPSKPPSM